MFMWNLTVAQHTTRQALGGWEKLREVEKAASSLGLLASTRLLTAVVCL